MYTVQKSFRKKCVYTHLCAFPSLLKTSIQHHHLRTLSPKRPIMFMCINNCIMDTTIPNHATKPQYQYRTCTATSSKLSPATGFVHLKLVPSTDLLHLIYTHPMHHMACTSQLCSLSFSSRAPLDSRLLEQGYHQLSLVAPLLPKHQSKQ